MENATTSRADSTNLAPDWATATDLALARPRSPQQRTSAFNTIQHDNKSRWYPSC